MGTVGGRTISSDGHGVGLQYAVTILVGDVTHEVFLAFGRRPAVGAGDGGVVGNIHVLVDVIEVQIEDTFRAGGDKGDQAEEGKDLQGRGGA